MFHTLTGGEETKPKRYKDPLTVISGGSDPEPDSTEFSDPIQIDPETWEPVDPIDPTEPDPVEQRPRRRKNPINPADPWNDDGGWMEPAGDGGTLAAGLAGAWGWVVLAGLVLAVIARR